MWDHEKKWVSGARRKDLGAREINLEARGKNLVTGLGRAGKELGYKEARAEAGTKERVLGQ